MTVVVNHIQILEFCCVWLYKAALSCQNDLKRVLRSRTVHELIRILKFLISGISDFISVIYSILTWSPSIRNTRSNDLISIAKSIFAAFIALAQLTPTWISPNNLFNFGLLFVTWRLEICWRRTHITKWDRAWVKTWIARKHLVVSYLTLNGIIHSHITRIFDEHILRCHC